MKSFLLSALISVELSVYLFPCCGFELSFIASIQVANVLSFTALKVFETLLTDPVFLLLLSPNGLIFFQAGFFIVNYVDLVNFCYLTVMLTQKVLNGITKIVFPVNQ